MPQGARTKHFARGPLGGSYGPDIGPILDDKLKENNPETLKGCSLFSLSCMCLSACLCVCGLNNMSNENDGNIIM